MHMLYTYIIQHMNMHTYMLTSYTLFSAMTLQSNSLNKWMEDI